MGGDELDLGPLAAALEQGDGAAGLDRGSAPALEQAALEVDAAPRDAR